MSVYQIFFYKIAVGKLHMAVLLASAHFLIQKTTEITVSALSKIFELNGDSNISISYLWRLKQNLTAISYQSKSDLTVQRLVRNSWLC